MITRDKIETFVSDQKQRWAGLLEVPLISKVQRLVLDGGRVHNLRSLLEDYPCKTVLEVGCGLGENCRAVEGDYCGIDNSFPRVQFAQQWYPNAHFILGDARFLPFGDKSFDMVMLIDTSHHLDDTQLAATIAEIKRVSRKYIVISDPVLSIRQSKTSAFFYRLDRGRCFRYLDEMKAIFDDTQGVVLQKTHSFRTFPGLYLHAAFVLTLA